MSDGPAPYPADTRAKGWRFELDYERIDQSDTWDIAAEVPMAQPALLMMWLVAWRQEPCGSLPNDEGTIRAKCRIPAATWAKVSAVLMRGWWLADDGRLYHKTVTARVLEMLEYRAATAKRVAKHKEAKRLERIGNTLTTASPTVKNDTGTGTGSKEGVEDGEGRDPPELPDLEGHTPTPGGLACRAIKAAGIPDTNPSHPDLLRLLAAGVTSTDLADAAAVVVLKGKPSFAYLLKTVEGQRSDAAAKAAVPSAPAKPALTVPSDEYEKTQARLAVAAAKVGTRPPPDLLARRRRAVEEPAA